MIALVAAVGVIVALAVLVLLSGAFVYIPNDRVGVVGRLWGAPSLTRGLIALSGEVGFQPQVFRSVIHYFFPFHFRVHRVDLVTIPQGEIGYIVTRYGRELVDGQTLGAIVAAGIEDVTALLRAGGQKGPQRAIIREGTHAINVAQFSIITASRVHGLLIWNEERDTMVADHVVRTAHGWQRRRNAASPFDAAAESILPVAAHVSTATKHIMIRHGRSLG
jgi:uncharacterized membrane protein YqiK